MKNINSDVSLLFEEISHKESIDWTKISLNGKSFSWLTPKTQHVKCVNPQALVWWQVCLITFKWIEFNPGHATTRYPSRRQVGHLSGSKNLCITFDCEIWLTPCPPLPGYMPTIILLFCWITLWSVINGWWEGCWVWRVLSYFLISSEQLRCKLIF